MGSEFPAIALKPNASGLKQVRHRRHGFPLAAAVTAHEENQLAEVHARTLNFPRSFFHKILVDEILAI